MTALPALPSNEMAMVLAKAPALPRSIKYWDDFGRIHRTLLHLSENDCWAIRNDGQDVNLAFDYLPRPYRQLPKLIAVEQLSRLDTSSVLKNLGRLRSLALRFGPLELFGMLLGLPLHEVRQHWLSVIQPNCSHDDAIALKSILHSLCIQAVGPWSPDLRSFVKTLPAPRGDLYRTVRTGDCFIPLDQQALLIDHFDEITSLIITDRKKIDDLALRDTCILIISHQHALRPGQIARIRDPDVRVYQSGAVHFAFTPLKQRQGGNVRSVTRRIKREWCHAFVEYTARRSRLAAANGVPEDLYFGLTPQAIGTTIERLVEQITGERWRARDLRHSAAQRLVDAGASHMVLAEFMTHKSIRSGNVYFDTSPTQAQRVNEALALSPIYATVAEVAKTRTIDKAALLRLPSDNQVGGVPHGIPIAGIGGCAAGQSTCTKNPVLSCYSCRKFMPINDASIHERVVESLRPVVLEFADASRGNGESPAYVQLRRTLASAQQIAAAIEDGQNLAISPEEVLKHEPDL